jgi:hypothetical protein
MERLLYYNECICIIFSYDKTRLTFANVISQCLTLEMIIHFDFDFLVFILFYTYLHRIDRALHRATQMQH